MNLPIAIFLTAIFTTPMGAPQKDIGGLKKDTKALMLYLQDKKDHKKYCPEIDWKQPPLTTYKKDPKSYLPKECKQ